MKGIRNTKRMGQFRKPALNTEYIARLNPLEYSALPYIIEGHGISRRCSSLSFTDKLIIKFYVFVESARMVEWDDEDCGGFL